MISPKAISPKATVTCKYLRAAVGAAEVISRPYIASVGAAEVISHPYS